VALSAVVEGEAGAVRAPGGRPRVVFKFTFSGDKVSEIEIVMDDERIAGNRGRDPGAGLT
jgi:hypothetical protein